MAMLFTIINHLYADSVNEVLNSDGGSSPRSLREKLSEVGITFQITPKFEKRNLILSEIDGFKAATCIRYVQEFIGRTNTASSTRDVTEHLYDLVRNIESTRLSAKGESESASTPGRPAEAPSQKPAPTLAPSDLSSNPVTSAPTPEPAVPNVSSAVPASSASTPAPSGDSQSPTLPSKTEEPPPPPPRPKAATWKEIDPTEPWCPESIQPHLGFRVNYQNNYSKEGAASPGWQIVAATRRGRMHAHNGTHREDAFDFAAEEQFTIVCVCDGGGSYQYSRIGSEATCRRVVGGLRKTLSSRLNEFKSFTDDKIAEEIQTLIGATVREVCEFLDALAASSETKLSDYRCTLVLGVFWLATETPFLMFSQVGDGFMAGCCKDGTGKRYGKSDSGAFSGEVNCFVPDAGAPEHAQQNLLITATNQDAFIFCSDGIEDPFFPIDKNATAIFHQLRNGVTEPLSGFEKQSVTGPAFGASDAAAQLEKWLTFEKKGENDDRTIVILHRTNGAGEPPLAEESKILSTVSPAPIKNPPSESAPTAAPLATTATGLASPNRPRRRNQAMTVGIGIFSAVVMVVAAWLYMGPLQSHLKPAAIDGPSAAPSSSAIHSPEETSVQVLATPALPKFRQRDSIASTPSPLSPAPSNGAAASDANPQDTSD